VGGLARIVEHKGFRFDTERHGLHYRTLRVDKDYVEDGPKLALKH